MTHHAADIGLRTHDIYEEQWIPPQSRMFTLQACDEPWARYFGLGSIARKHALLYDVRDEHSELLGYTRFDPEKCVHDLRLAVAEQFDDIWPDKPMPTSTIRTIAVRSAHFRFQGSIYRCWIASMKDIQDMQASGFLAVFDRDRLREKQREYESRQFYMDLNRGRCR